MNELRHWIKLCEELHFATMWYHGTSESLDIGPYPYLNKKVFLTTDKEDAAFYGRHVYECSVSQGKVADLWNRRSAAYRSVVRKLSSNYPNIAKFLDSGKMWEINKTLERTVRNFLMRDEGYDTIDFRDNSPNDDSEIGSIVTWAKNVKIVKQLQ